MKRQCHHISIGNNITPPSPSPWPTTLTANDHHPNPNPDPDIPIITFTVTSISTSITWKRTPSKLLPDLQPPSLSQQSPVFIVSLDGFAAQISSHHLPLCRGFFRIPRLRLYQKQSVLGYFQCVLWSLECFDYWLSGIEAYTWELSFLIVFYGFHR